MPSVCIEWPTNGQWRTQWSYLISNFNPDNVWIVGLETKDTDLQGIPLDSFSDLPKDMSRVVCQPQNGKWIQGEVSLLDFEHPQDAVYIFGPDNYYLTQQQLGFEPDHLVYIPTPTHHDMWSFVAGGIVLYDQMYKNERGYHG